MNGWLDGWMTNLSFKKITCMHGNKKYHKLRKKHAGIAAKPRDNSEISESVKVSNSMIQLRNAKQRIYLSRSN